MSKLICSNSIYIRNVSTTENTFWCPIAAPEIKVLFSCADKNTYTVSVLSKFRALMNGVSERDWYYNSNNWDENFINKSQTSIHRATNIRANDLLLNNIADNSDKALADNSSGMVVYSSDAQKTDKYLMLLPKKHGGSGIILNTRSVENGKPSLSMDDLNTAIVQKQYICGTVVFNKFTSVSFFLDFRSFLYNISPSIVVTLYDYNKACRTDSFPIVDEILEKSSAREMKQLQIPWNSDNLLKKLEDTFNTLFKQTGIEFIAELNTDDNIIYFREYARHKPLKPKDLNVKNIDAFTHGLSAGSVDFPGVTEEEKARFNRLKEKFNTDGEMSLDSWRAAHELYNNLCARLGAPALELKDFPKSYLDLHKNTRGITVPEFSLLEDAWDEIVLRKEKENKETVSDFYKAVSGSNAEFLLQRKNFFNFLYFQDIPGVNKHLEYIEKYEREGHLSLSDWKDLLRTYRDNVLAMNLTGVQIGQWKTLNEEISFEHPSPSELLLTKQKSVKNKQEKEENATMSSPGTPSPKQQNLDREHQKKMDDLQRKQNQLQEAENKRQEEIEKKKQLEIEKFQKETRIAEVEEELRMLKGVKKGALQTLGSAQGVGIVALFFAFLATMFQFLKPKAKKKKKRRPEYMQQREPEKVVEKEKVLIREEA